MVTEHATWKGEPTVLYYVEYRLGLQSGSPTSSSPTGPPPEGDKAFQAEVGDVLESLKLTEH